MFCETHSKKERKKSERKEERRTIREISLYWLIFRREPEKPDVREIFALLIFNMFLLHTQVKLEPVAERKVARECPLHHAIEQDRGDFVHAPLTQSSLSVSL